MSILGWLFRRNPKYEVSAYRDVYTALVSALAREGVSVGKTASYPRVEIDTFLEGERLDKEGAIRQITCNIESISNTSLSQAATMNEENLELLTKAELDVGTDWVCLGIIPAQLQDLTETSDTNKILYRLNQSVNIFLERIKTDTEPEPAQSEPTEPEEETDN